MESRTKEKLAHGFLDLKINECIPKWREEHQAEYKIIFDLMQFLYSIEDNFIGKDATQQDVFLMSSILELNRLFQSAVLLFERGIPASANIIIRTILELSLNIVETIKNEEYIQEILFNELKEMRSTVNIAKEFNRLDLIPPERIQEIQETYESFGERKSKKKNVKDLAIKNGFEVEYLLYRTYCGNTHMSASVLAKNFKVSSLGVVYDGNIQLSDFKNDLCRLIGITMISIPILVNDYIMDDNLSKQYDLIYENLGNVFA